MSEKDEPKPDEPKPDEEMTPEEKLKVVLEPGVLMTLIKAVPKESIVKMVLMLADELLIELSPTLKTLVKATNAINDNLKTVEKRSMILQYKSDLCYELLTDEQKKEARAKLQARFKTEGQEYTPIEQVLEKYDLKL